MQQQCKKPSNIIIFICTRGGTICIYWSTAARLYEKYSTGEHVKRQIQHEEKPSAVFVLRHPKCCIFYTDKHRQCFNWYIVFPEGKVFASISMPKTLFMNRLVSISTSFYNLRLSLKLMLQVKFLAEWDNFVISSCRWAKECWRECYLLLATLKLFSLAAINTRDMKSTMLYFSCSTLATSW